MRVAIGEFAHETNTFCPGLTEVAHFRARHCLPARRSSTPIAACATTSAG